MGLAVFALASLGMYCYLGEKVPWLGVHQVWAFVPLAGAQLARTFGPAGRWWSRSLAAVGLLMLGATSFVASFVLEEITPFRPHVESLHFVQTCPELVEVAREVTDSRVDAESGPVAAVAGEAAWPLTWYWRHLDIFWGPPRPGIRPPVVVCDPDDEVTLRRTLGVGYDRRRIPLRAWWLMYQARPSMRELVRYAVLREPWGGIGSTDVVVLRRTGEASDPIVEDADAPLSLRAPLGVVAARVIGRGWLAEPRGIALRGDRLAVADVGLSQLVVFDRDGRLVANDDLPPLNQPEDVAWVDDDRVVVADTWNHRVLEIELASGAVRELPSPNGGWYGPRSVAVDDRGRLAASDTGNKRVVVAGGVGDSWRVTNDQVIEPGGVEWTVDGDLLVCDTGNRRVRRLNPDGEVVADFPVEGGWTDFYSRPQVAMAPDGTVVVSDTPGRALWVLRDGTIQKVELEGAGIEPTGVAWSDDGRTLAVGDLTGRVWLLEVGNG
jgi:sugar lactone lactonase YvrE